MAERDARPDELTRVLVLTTFDDDDTVNSALRAGASGFMLKHASPTEVADAVKGLPLNPSLTTVRIAEDGGRLRIVVTYDASRHPLMLLGGMIPRPPAVIERSAVVRVGEE